MEKPFISPRTPCLALSPLLSLLPSASFSFPFLARLPPEGKEWQSGHTLWTSCLLGHSKSASQAPSTLTTLRLDLEMRLEVPFQPRPGWFPLFERICGINPPFHLLMEHIRKEEGRAGTLLTRRESVGAPVNVVNRFLDS